MIKLIFKAILLWITTIVVILFFSGIDSIIESSDIMLWILAVIILVYLSYTLIDNKEFNIISGNALLERIIERNFDSDDEF